MKWTPSSVTQSISVGFEIVVFVAVRTVSRFVVGVILTHDFEVNLF